MRWNLATYCHYHRPTDPQTCEHFVACGICQLEPQALSSWWTAIMLVKGCLGGYPFGDFNYSIQKDNLHWLRKRVETMDQKVPLQPPGVGNAVEYRDSMEQPAKQECQDGVHPTLCPLTEFKKRNVISWGGQQILGYGWYWMVCKKMPGVVAVTSSSACWHGLRWQIWHDNIRV